MNTAYDGHFGILTLAEVIELARRRSTADRQIRVLAELKHTEGADSRGLPMAELVTEELRRLDATDAEGSVVLQSFDAEILRDLRARLGADGPQMVQLVGDAADGDKLVTRAGLRAVSTYAQAIGPSRERVLRSAAPPASGQGAAGPRGAPGRARRLLLDPAGGERLPARAPPPRHVAARPRERGRRRPALLDLGVDGLITDSPDHAVQACAELQPLRADTRGPEASPRSRARSAQRGTAPGRGVDRRTQPIRSWMTTFSSRPGPTPITLIRAPESSSSRRT